MSPELIAYLKRQEVIKAIKEMEQTILRQEQLKVRYPGLNEIQLTQLDVFLQWLGKTNWVQTAELLNASYLAIKANKDPMLIIGILTNLANSGFGLPLPPPNTINPFVLVADNIEHLEAIAHEMSLIEEGIRCKRTKLDPAIDMHTHFKMLVDKVILSAAQNHFLKRLVDKPLRLDNENTKFKNIGNFGLDNENLKFKNIGNFDNRFFEKKILVGIFTPDETAELERLPTPVQKGSSEEVYNFKKFYP
jgi:hypothetical protein